MLDDRKKKVLQAIVEEYINSAEPVSSNAIMNKYNLMSQLVFQKCLHQILLLFL